MTFTVKFIILLSLLFNIVILFIKLLLTHRNHFMTLLPKITPHILKIIQKKPFIIFMRYSHNIMLYFLTKDQNFVRKYARRSLILVYISFSIRVSVLVLNLVTGYMINTNFFGILMLIFLFNGFLRMFVYFGIHIDDNPTLKNLIKTDGRT
jgi:hypothetical protein